MAYTVGFAMPSSGVLALKSITSAENEPALVLANNPDSLTLGNASPVAGAHGSEWMLLWMALMLTMMAARRIRRM